MFDGVTQHYNQYYRYDIPSGEDPGVVVSRLYEAVMRNDKNALEQLLKILASNTYYLVCNRLEHSGNATQDNVDDVMQNVRMEVVKLAFRGFSGNITGETLFPYLIGVVEHCVLHFRKEDQRRNVREEYDSDDHSALNTLKEREMEYDMATPEQQFLERERKIMVDQILKKYVIALQESKLPPYQLLTYCYAIVIPQLFKKTDKKELLTQIDRISGRKSLPPNSHYNEEENRLEGDITRDSVILMNWAMDAMYQQTLSQLDQEFLQLYHIEKIADMAFQWGMYYKANMEKNYGSISMREVVITDEFQKNAIKNWPGRVAKSLLSDTEKHFLSEKGVRERSVHIVEAMLR